MDLFVKEEKGLSQNEVNDAAPKAPGQWSLAKGLVQPQGGEGNQKGRDEEKQEGHVIGQWHCNNAIMQDIEPGVKGNRHGDQEDERIQQYIEEIQGSLVFFYHSKGVPFTTQFPLGPARSGVPGPHIGP